MFCLQKEWVKKLALWQGPPPYLCSPLNRTCKNHRCLSPGFSHLCLNVKVHSTPSGFNSETHVWYVGIGTYP